MTNEEMFSLLCTRLDDNYQRLDLTITEVKTELKTEIKKECDALRTEFNSKFDAQDRRIAALEQRPAQQQPNNISLGDAVVYKAILS